MLKLRIPRQETVIPQGRFIILTDDGPEDENNNPLRIGVTVNGDKTKYYTYIDDEGKGDGGKNLYLNLTENRFVETIIEFESPNLNAEDGENWIRLNNSNYAEGVLSRPIVTQEGVSNLWGRVKGDTIDIPIMKKDGTKRKLEMRVFDKNDNELKKDLNVTPGEECKFPLTSGNNKNFIISRENTDDNFIRFTLDHGYEVGTEDDIEFYIRYIDTSEGKEDFLFDQRYIIKFKNEINYKGDINVRFKNPSMTVINNTKGVIDIFEEGYAGSGNHDTTEDSIEDWAKVKIRPSKEEVVSQIKADFSTSYVLKEIEEGKTAENLIVKLEKDNFFIGLPETRTEFEEVFGPYKGQQIEKSFELIFDKEPRKAYRLNIIIDEFDPRYYGKVFDKQTNENYINYEEINNVGQGEIDLTDDNNLKSDGYVYVDLNTSYRNYMRYRAVPKSFGDDLTVRSKKVEAIPDDFKSKVVHGDLVLYDGKNYIDLTKNPKVIEFKNNGVSDTKDYPLKLRLELAEYQKLRPYTKYKIYLDGNQNVLTIGTDTLNKNILFKEPLNFYTNGPRLKISNSTLDFGRIKPKFEKENLIKKQAKTEITVEIINTLDSNLEVTKRELVPETDTVFINQVSTNGTPVEDGGKLKVRDLKTTKKIIAHGAGITLEVYELEGTLEVNKDIPDKNYGEYRGKAVVEYTFY